ncbi:Hypothetical predicted protein [Pelobates cultripes]|uniref:Uncharacterized protein n=1 Tax=Pelobates cultripes TaxID=61616 RepID=A0AAD1RVN9_PELCU|nr:Hypothetical predicted protein [Pelobates cultripes]
MQASTGVLVHRDLEIPSIELLLVITIHLLQIPIKHGDITICAYRVRRCREDGVGTLLVALGWLRVTYRVRRCREDGVGTLLVALGWLRVTYRVRRCREDRGRYIVGGLRLAEGDIPCEKVLQDRGRYIVGDLGLAEGEFAIMLGILIVI